MDGVNTPAPRAALGTRVGTTVSVALLACVLLLGLRLLSLPLYPLCDRTESRYAEIAREMQVSGDYVSPHLQGTPFWGKPPLATWCEAAGIQVFGANEFAVRFPAWLAVLVTLWAVWGIGRAVGGRRLGRTSAIVCCTAPLTLFMAGGVMTDPFLVLGTTLALLGVVRIASLSVEEGQAHGTPASATLTIVLGLVVAALSKGPIGLLFGGAPVLGLLLSREGRARARVFPYMSVAMGFVILGVPWFVLAESRTPGFLEYFLLGEHVHRFLDPHWSGDLYGGTHAKPHGIVWLYFALALLPWLPAAFRAMYLSGARRMRTQALADPLVGVLLVSMGLPLVLFTVAGSLLPTYVYPSVPAASVLIALGIRQSAAVSPRLRRARTRVPVALAATMALIVVALPLVPEGIWIDSSQRDILADVPQSNVVYGRPIDTLYSAAFYSEGRSHAAVDAADPLWSVVRAAPEKAAVVTKDRDQSRIPMDLRLRLRLDRDVSGIYQLWHVDVTDGAREDPAR
jgi:4-amino-4-deoxy-L-arabinose transferase-like glycosyltransferase